MITVKAGRFPTRRRAHLEKLSQIPGRRKSRHLSFTAAKSIRGLEKPEKIYLNNPNQAFAICNHETVNEGTLREMFFICMLQERHRVALPPKGDFIVNHRHVFTKIPLWLFGFLY